MITWFVNFIPRIFKLHNTIICTRLRLGEIHEIKILLYFYMHLVFFLYITNWLIPIFLVAKCRIGAVFAYDLIKKNWTFWEWQQRKGLSKKDFFYQQDSKGQKGRKRNKLQLHEGKISGRGDKMICTIKLSEQLSVCNAQNN